MVNKQQKVLKSQKICQDRVREKIKIAEKRIAEYRRLVAAEGIESRRLVAIDAAKESHKNRDAHISHQIDESADCKKSIKIRKHWHRHNNGVHKEWKDIYQNMGGDYAKHGWTDRGATGGIDDEDESTTDAPVEKKESNGRHTKTPKQFRTKKGQPIMNLKIADLYRRCALDSSQKTSS
ncbi:hypothetical protein XU18_1351 [Perkinsela sp. CCAP 1560/4]|nr:hypothetical protein XU18_1351 [Perkinsela sp. CCAP 1560/4]|eukprot:KNH08021.1 hypothetical protein XU18_1351 [Perkinsela sp. CCAP 1560/4]